MLAVVPPLSQLKHGEIHSTVYAAAVLTGNEYALEVQMSAYTLLQILVGCAVGSCSCNMMHSTDLNKIATVAALAAAQLILAISQFLQQLLTDSMHEDSMHWSDDSSAIVRQLESAQLSSSH
jgi:hypothetical protein